MKKYFLALLFFSSVFSSAQTNVYHQFPDSNATWTCHFFAGMWPIYGEYYTYTLSGDTVIGAYTYRKINIPYIDEAGDTTVRIINSGYQGCIREDTIQKKVYYVIPGTSVDTLLYDFSLQVGDVSRGYMRYSAFPNDTVQYIDSILIGSDYHKRWGIGNLAAQWGYFIIEGIGYGGGLLESTAGYSLDGPRLELDCFQQEGTPMYVWNSSACYVIDGMNENPYSGISIFPNPARSQLTVESRQYTINSIQVFNLQGEKIYSSVVHCESCIVNCASFPPGVYFVKATSGDKIFYKKFIKE